MTELVFNINFISFTHSQMHRFIGQEDNTTSCGSTLGKHLYTELCQVLKNNVFLLMSHCTLNEIFISVLCCELYCFGISLTKNTVLYRLVFDYKKNNLLFFSSCLQAGFSTVILCSNYSMSILVYSFVYSG